MSTLRIMERWQLGYFCASPFIQRGIIRLFGSDAPLAFCLPSYQLSVMGDAAKTSASVMDTKVVASIVSLVVQSERQRLVNRERGIRTVITAISSSVHPCRFCTCRIDQNRLERVQSHIPFIFPLE